MILKKLTRIIHTFFFNYLIIIEDHEYFRTFYSFVYKD
jgi:hypothetical protein